MAGKKYEDAGKRFDRDQLFSAPEALDLVKNLAPAKFDETVEMVVRLGVDPRKADQMVRGTVSLPSGTGKDVRVAVLRPARPRPRPARRVRTSSVPTTWPPRSRRATWTSTWPSPRRT